MSSSRRLPPSSIAAAGRETSSVRGRKVLVIGLSPEVNRSVVSPLLDLGIAALGTTQPNEASQLFNARDFELIVFGRGALGPISDRLKQAFSTQNPDIRFVDAIHPAAVAQTLAALAHDPGSPRFIRRFRVTRDEAGAGVEADILAPCRLTLTLYRLGKNRLGMTDVLPEVLADADAQSGHFKQQIEAGRLKDANSVLLSVEAEEYHLHPFLT